MPGYAAFLRGVSPLNATMAELRTAFEQAGFTEVRTVLGSGNVVFQAPRAAERDLERKAEAAMEQVLGHSFLTFVRPADALRMMLATDPYRDLPLAPGAKRIVTFLRDTPRGVRLPVEEGGATLLALDGRTVFGAYVRSPRGAVFMRLIERTLGKDVTTRTWDTVAKVAAASR